MTAWLWAAAVTAIVTFFVHTFVGGKRVARPLLANNSLPRASKWLNYYCWHIATVLLAFMAVMFVKAALVPADNGFLPYLNGLCLSLSTLSIVIGFKAGINPLHFPSTSLFALMAVFGSIAVLTGA